MLLRVLDEERKAEENRVRFMQQALTQTHTSQISHSSNVITDPELTRTTMTTATHQLISLEGERRQLELLFAEERRRASERIVNLTKEHEVNLKNAMLSIMRLEGTVTR